MTPAEPPLPEPPLPGAASAAPANAGGASAVRSASRAREAQGAAVLGWFHLALAVPVLAGTLFAELAIDRALNVAAGVVLGIVGGGLLWASRRIARAASERPGEPRS
jgi:hypothetical protein